MNLQNETIKAIDKHAAALVAELGVSSIDEFDPALLTANERQAALLKINSTARSLIEKVTDGCSVARAERIERAFDGLRLVMDEIDAIGNFTQRSSRRPGGYSATARGDGSADEPAVVTVGLTREQRMTDWHKREVDPASEYAGLRVGQYLRSMAIGAKTDLEKRALAEGTDSAGGYTVPSVIAASLIDLLRAQSVCIQAGAVTLPLISDSNSIAKLATDPTPAWRAENAAVAESDPTFANVLLTPRSLAVQVKVSRELLEDSLNLETELPRIMAAAMAKEWDRVALLGTGTAPQPRGIANTSGIGTAALAGALTSYAPLVTARTAIKTANAEPTAIIMHPRDEGTLTGLTASDNQPLMAPAAIRELPMLTTTSIPTNGGAGTDESTLFMGDFRHLYLGLRSVIRVDVLRELYAGNHQYGFVCHMRGDVAVAHAGAFHTTTAVEG